MGRVGSVKGLHLLVLLKIYCVSNVCLLESVLSHLKLNTTVPSEGECLLPRHVFEIWLALIRISMALWSHIM